MKFDVIIIGGSYAGLSAALQLGRARKRVLVVDAGERRNRFASHSHGFLGQDGKAPGEIVSEARSQIERYPTIEWARGRVTDAEGTFGDFEVEIDGGRRESGARLILAMGVTDELPDIAGLKDRWGPLFSTALIAMATNWIRERSALSRLHLWPYIMH